MRLRKNRSGQYDAIVIGAGHNGLTAAAYLARAGKSVLIVEARERIGGMAATGRLTRGYHVSSCAHLVHSLHPQIIRDLNLYKLGLEYSERRIPTIGLREDGAHLVLANDLWRDRTSIAHHSELDAEAFAPFMKRMTRIAWSMQPFLTQPPPATRERFRSLMQAIKRLGDDGRELQRIAFASVADVVEPVFESDIMRGVLAADATLGASEGPRAPGTVLPWLYRLTGECSGFKGALGHPRGGMGAVPEALWAAAREKGATLRTGLAVSAIDVRDDRVSGVVLSTGEELRAPVVLSSLDPRTTFLDLIGPLGLDTEVVRVLTHWRARGAAAKVNLALDGMPEFPGLDADLLRGRFMIASDLEHVELAADPAKYGNIPDFPVIEALIPSVHDTTLTPDGCHVLSAIVQYVPYDVKGGWDEARDRLADLVVGRLESFFPNLGERIVARQVLAPPDIEREFGCAGGHWHHGDLTFNQFAALRPDPAVLLGRGPIDGLYLCGAGAHPGGGVTGIPGYNAARLALGREGA